MVNHRQRKKNLQRQFTDRFGDEPQLWTRAPGRVDLMGSHTDYNEGFVMTMTIDRDTWVAARRRPDSLVQVASLNLPGISSFSLVNFNHDRTYPWSDYVRGMIWAFQEGGFSLSGFDALIHSTVPFGSGLSSSAALEMAIGVMLSKMNSLNVPKVTLAKLGQRAENQFVGVNTGILDQYSSVMGEENHAILLDCRSLTSHPVAIASGLQVVICDTNAKRALVSSEYDDRRRQCEQGVAALKAIYPDITALRDVSPAMLKRHEALMPPTVFKRCKFIVEENQRCLDLAAPLAGGDVDDLARLYSASYLGARDLYEISSPEMDAMQSAMTLAPGVIAARQTGAGFGGSMIALVSDDAVTAFADFVKADYQRRTGIAADIYPVQASQGAGLIHFPPETRQA